MIVLHGRTAHIRYKGTETLMNALICINASLGTLRFPARAIEVGVDAMRNGIGNVDNAEEIPVEGAFPSQGLGNARLSLSRIIANLRK